MRLSGRVFGLGLALLAFVVGVFVAVAWYFAERIEDGTLHVDHSRNLDYVVESAGGGRIELKGSSANGRRDGLWGLYWPGGYARVGRIIESDAESVVRELDPAWDTPTPGTRVSFDSLAFPDDPKRALGVDYREVTVSSPGGEFPAWFIPGTHDTWVVAVHGMGSRRAEAFRTFATTVALGYPSLTITYRNDDGLAASADGRYDYGRSEWPDLEAAVTYAKANGAAHVIVAGYSMGGAITLSFMEHSALSGEVSGLILDTPVLSFEKVIDYQAERRHLPGVLTSFTKRLVGWRSGVDWGALEYRDDAASLRVPVLLFHGVDDDRAPVSVSDAFAQSRPDIVTYVRVPGATHVRSWNMDPARYDAAIRVFLAKVAP